MVCIKKRLLNMENFNFCATFEHNQKILSLALVETITRKKAAGKKGKFRHHAFLRLCTPLAINNIRPISRQFYRALFPRESIFKSNGSSEMINNKLPRPFKFRNFLFVWRCDCLFLFFYVNVH